MPKFEITYSRSFSITYEFATEAEAKAWAEKHLDDTEAYSEANGLSPWEISVKETFAHDPARCPSDHWNRGDEISARTAAPLWVKENHQHEPTCSDDLGALHTWKQRR